MHGCDAAGMWVTKKDTRRARRKATRISTSKLSVLPLLRRVTLRAKKTKSGYGKHLDTAMSRGAPIGSQPPKWVSNRKCLTHCKWYPPLPKRPHLPLSMSTRKHLLPQTHGLRFYQPHASIGQKTQPHFLFYRYSPLLLFLANMLLVISQVFVHQG